MYAWKEQEPTKVKAPDLETAKQWREEVLAEINTVMQEMKNTSTRQEMQELQDKHYELIQVKRSIQNSMTNIVRARASA